MFTIAIDPDLHKSGFSLYENNHFIDINSYTLLYIVNFLQKNKDNIKIVILEYPKNTFTYHAGGKGAALNVGKNQAVAIIIKEILIELNINYKLVYPNGYSNYFKNVDFFKKISNWEKKTNADARTSAAILLHNF